ncbi:hypothetical protein ACWDN6_14440 [Streptomyces albogriseolus]
MSRRCAYCEQPIGPDEEAKRVPVDVPTGAGDVLLWHAYPCKRPQRQAYPNPR